MNHLTKRTYAVILIAFGVLSSRSVNAEEAPALKDLEPKIDRALKAYNAQDFKAFYADYAKAVAATCTAQAFKTLYTDGAMEKFGAYQSKQLLKHKTFLIARVPLVVYAGKFKKAPARISVNFLQEGDEYRVVQIRIDPLK